MKTKTVGLTLALTLIGAALCWASPHMGTWTLNEAKSKIPAGASKNTKVVYEAAGDQVKVIVDGIDAEGKPIHNEWTGKFDGKDYAVTGDPSIDMRAYKQVNEHTLEMTFKHDGKVVGGGKVVVSADGKTRTVTNEWKDAKGKQFKTTGVYDKS
jgi:flagellar hook assembly protein FlgD